MGSDVRHNYMYKHCMKINKELFIRDWVKIGSMNLEGKTTTAVDRLDR